MQRFLTVLAAASFLVCAACDNFPAVQQADTIEAYEEYTKANPTGRWATQAKTRLEELYLERAKEAKTLQSYDAYLKRFPEGAYRERAMTEREDFFFASTANENTVDSWKRFLAEYPRTKKKRRDKAERALKVAEYAPQLEVGAVRQEKVNMAEDPNGPLNGWGFWVDVKNNGKETLKRLDLTIEYLDDQGKAADRKEWPVVSDWWSVPIEEEHKVPMKPGQTRTWYWSAGDMPKDWAETVRVYPSRVIYKG